jgi:predicted porin
MRKTQLALAAVALVASTAALADVTLYGTVDAAVEQSTGNGTYLNGTGGFVAGNNFGIKGSEELSGGLKANFTLQQGFNLNQGRSDNGGGGFNTTSTTDMKNAASTFNQVASVGLSGDFGTITLGQQLSPFIATLAGGTAGNGNFFVNAIILGGSAAGGGANQGGGFFIPNAISYTSPEIGGFTATVLTSGRANAISGGVTQNDVNKYTAGSVSTSFAGVNVGLTADQRSGTDTCATTCSYRNVAAALSTTIGDFGVAATVRSYTAPYDTTDGKYSTYTGSVSYNVSEALTLAAQYASGNDASITTGHAKYSLSKSTFLYATMGRASAGAQSAYVLRATGTAANDHTALGIVKSF